MLATSRTFYAQQSANRRNSLLLLASVFLLFALLGLTGGYGYTGNLTVGIVAMVAGLVVAGLMSSVSYFQGDRMVLAASKAQPVDETSHPELMNIVREISIAAGAPMPKVYVIPDTALNAFATGRDPKHASIAVTQGLLERLDREEMQGVIAHELSHVRNFDIRFMLLIGVLVGGIALLADVMLRAGYLGAGRKRDRRSGGGADMVVLILALILAVLAPIAARLVQLSVSRQREYLADATAVELTRNPAGLESALWKLGTDREVLEVANRSTQHMYVVNPIRKFEARASSLWSTHPPLADRINRLRELRAMSPLDGAALQALSGH